MQNENPSRSKKNLLAETAKTVEVKENITVNTDVNKVEHRKGRPDRSKAHEDRNLLNQPASTPDENIESAPLTATMGACLSVETLPERANEVPHRGMLLLLQTN